jgi:hypothetical protein
MNPTTVNAKKMQYLKKNRHKTIPLVCLSHFEKRTHALNSAERRSPYIHGWLRASPAVWALQAEIRRYLAPDG